MTPHEPRYPRRAVVPSSGAFEQLTRLVYEVLGHALQRVSAQAFAPADELLRTASRAPAQVNRSLRQAPVSRSVGA
jgi:hypothetical protein